MSDVTQLAFPTARATDPDTSREAARTVRAANAEMVTLIRATLAYRGPLTHEEIAETVERMMPGRWTRGGIVSACARAGLRAVGTTRNSRGRTVQTWTGTDFNSDVDGAGENVSTSPEAKPRPSTPKPSPVVPIADGTGW